MTSTSASAIPLQQQQLAGSAASQPPSSGGGRIPLDEISKLFHLPIAEAASILGVCTSVLKRICRVHGIVRWPYRKLIAGKTIEEINKDAAGGRTNELVDSSKIATQRNDSSKMLPMTTVGPSSTFGNQFPGKPSTIAQDTSKMQQYQQQMNRLSRDGWVNALHGSTRHITTYMDEFKFGFPINGLTSSNHKWWGSGKKESSEKCGKKDESSELSDKISGSVVVDGQEGSNANSSKDKPKPSSSLCSTRKNAVEYGHNALKLGNSKGFESHKLRKRQRSVLLRVFKTSLPDQWKDSFS